MEYKFLGSETIYSGKVFDLTHTHLRLPNGKEHTYDLIAHHGAVVILPVDEQGNIWFVRQYRVGAQEWLLELPAGVLEPGEPPEAAARRELQEEVGKAGEQFIPLGQFYMVPGYSTEKLHAFLSLGLRDSRLQADDDEFLEPVALPVKEAMAMAQRGEIQDGKTLAVLLLALPQLQKFLEG